MATDKPSSDAFLAMVEAKIAALKTLADSYRAALSLGALGQPGEVDFSALPTSASSRSDVPFELPQGALLGKSLPAAIKLYLSAVKKKQTIREIANALKEGGVESTAASFENNVTSALHRLRASQDVLKFNDGWAFAELYPETLRTRIAAQDAKPKASANKKRPATKTAAKAKASIKTPKAATGPSLDQRIATYLATHKGFSLTPQQVGAALNELDSKVVGLAFARLARYGKVVKRDDGSYAIAPSASEHLKAV